MSDTRAYGYFPPYMGANTDGGYTALGSDADNEPNKWYLYSKGGGDDSRLRIYSERDPPYYQFNVPTPIHPTRIVFTGNGWSYQYSGVSRPINETQSRLLFTGFPTIFKVDGWNGTEWVELHNQVTPLGRGAVENDQAVWARLPTPTDPLYVYENRTDGATDTNPRPDTNGCQFLLADLGQDKYYTQFRVDLTGATTNALTGFFQVGGIHIWGTTDAVAPPYYEDTGEKQIIDLATDLTLGDNAINIGSLLGVNYLTINIAPDQFEDAGQFTTRKAQIITTKGIINEFGTDGQGYIRISKSNIDGAGSLIPDAVYSTQLQFRPLVNQKSVRFNENSVIYREYVFDDDFYYFELVPSLFGIGGTPLGDTYIRMTTLFNNLNGVYNILNGGDVDYESGLVAHPSVNFARTFGTTPTYGLFFNETYLDRPPTGSRPEIYPTAEQNCLTSTSLVFGGTSFAGTQIKPIKYSTISTQKNQLVVTTDKTSTKDLYHLFFDASNLYLYDAVAPSDFAGLSSVVVVDGDTGREIVYDMSYTSSVPIGLTKNLYAYSVVMSVTDIIDLATIPSDPALPSGMPSALEYNKVVVSNATNQPININEMKIYENQLDNLTNSYVKAIYDSDGRRYNSLIKDGTITHYPSVWNSSTLTNEQFVAIVADSTQDETNVITLEADGIKYVKSGTTGKINLYSFGDTDNTQNIQIGTIKGWSAVFTGGSGDAPFLAVYTKAKGDGSDKAGWYNSRYVLTDGVGEGTITSGKLYTLDDALISASQISTTAGFTDEIFLVSIHTSSSDTSQFTLTISEMNMIGDYVGGDLTIEYGHAHNLAITQNVVLTSNYNQVGMKVSFYNDDALVFESTELTDAVVTTNMKFNLVEANKYSGEIVADVVVNQELAFYLGWTKSNFDLDLLQIRADFATTSSVSFGLTFTPLEKLTSSCRIHADKLRVFKYELMETEVAGALQSLALEGDFLTAEIMYIKQGLGFGLTPRQAVEYGIDRIKPENTRMVKLLLGRGGD
jgi:hypothetical protein